MSRTFLENRPVEMGTSQCVLGAIKPSLWLDRLDCRKAEKGWCVKGGEAVHFTLDVADIFCY